VGSPSVSDCSLLVAITFHHVPRRVIHLLDVMRSLADIPARHIDIRVMINDVPDATIAALQDILAGTLSDNATLRFERCTSLNHPFELAWEHRRLIPDEFLAEGSLHTHFVYLEDDMRFSARNLRHFLAYREPLAEYGLIPSLVRVEFDPQAPEMRCTDIQQTLKMDSLKQIPIGPYVFVSPLIPYYAAYVLDQALAREFIPTRSFTLKGSEAVRSSGVRERAAMGICWENIPRGFRSRYAIPIDPARGIIAADAWLPHLPNNYIDKPGTLTGKLPMRHVLVPRPAAEEATTRAG